MKKFLCYIFKHKLVWNGNHDYLNLVKCTRCGATGIKERGKFYKEVFK